MESTKNQRDLEQLEEGDYILIVTNSKISFAGRFTGKNIIENVKVLTFKPDEGGNLWISVGEDFLKKIYILEKRNEKGVF